MTAPKAARSSAGASAARRWLLRGAIALVIGLALGGAAGVFTVNRLEPGRPNGVDSLQVMLDSLARGRIAAPDASGGAPAPVSSAPTAVDTPATVDSVAVPSLVDLEEGAARTAVLDAGLQVGEVRFEASTKPAGTVLATVPAGGTTVARATPVALVLSDGRPPTDTLALSLPLLRP